MLEREWMNSQQVAELLGVSPRMVRYLAKTRPDDIGAMRIGHDWLFRRELVEEFAKSYRPSGRGPKPSGTRANGDNGV